MKNKISIDEMVRQKVAHGEEPHNLGAWANMERMLDGKNPYGKESDDEKSRPWLFMFLAVALLSSSLVGGYYYFSNDNATLANGTKTTAHSPSEVVKNAIDSEIPVHAEYETNSKAEATAGVEENDTPENQNKTQLLASASNDDAIASTLNTAKQSRLDAIKNSRSTLKQVPTSSNTSVPEKKITSNSLDVNTATVTASAKPMDKKDFSKKMSTVPKATGLDASKTNTNALAAKTPLEVPPTITETYLDTMTVIEVNNSYQRNLNGNKVLVSDSNTYDVVQQKERTVINPRYIELTKEQEEAAQRRTLTASSNKGMVNIPPSFDKPETQAPKTDATVGLNQSSKTKQKKGFLTLFQEAFQKINQKAINIAHTKYPIYTGMFVGVNAALINTQHNFGGFQGGFSAMTPLSRIFSLTTEARFIHKNNSGYTVTDYENRILNTHVDNTSWTKGKIYTYDVDSVSTGHNLDNFYSIQVPVTLTAHIKKFDVYGGVHLNYGFRMNVNSSQKSNPITIVDSVNYSTPYTERVGTSSKFTRDDFGNRFGLGYTVGGAYNFNSKLYLDLRMSNLFWDNTKGAAKSEISDVFFRLPSFQLSLGYRFRDFERSDD